MTGTRRKNSLGMRVGASSKGSIQEKDKRKGRGTEKGNEGNIEMHDNSIEEKNEFKPRNKKKTRRNKRGKHTQLRKDRMQNVIKRQ